MQNFETEVFFFSCLIQPKEITWCPSRVFPPVRACMFSSHLTAVTFLADPSAGGGLPRGTFIYATSPVPVQVSICNVCLPVVLGGGWEGRGQAAHFLLS